MSLSTLVVSLKGYRTFIVNAVIAALGLLTALGLIPVGEAVSAEAISANIDVVIGAVAIVAAAVNAVLRLFTNTEPGSKE